MCNCSKVITQSECDMLKELNNDPLKRFFIYHISDLKGLMVAYVPKGINPNQIAEERGFLDDNNQPQWFNTKEHPCINE